MEVKAALNNYRVSAQKARLVANQIRGKGVEEALNLLTLSPKRVADPIAKLLRSAVANAQNRGDESGEVVDVDDLVVREVFVDVGPTLRRFRAAAQGRAAPRRRRMSHITVVVDTRE